MQGRGNRVRGHRARMTAARLLFGLLIVVTLTMGFALTAMAGEVAIVSAQEEAPYTPPEINNVDVPGWLQPLEPLARLPLWGQAAVLSAGVAGMFFVIPMVFRWVWNLGDDPSERKDEPRE